MVRIVFTRSPLAVDLHPRHRAAVSHDARKAVDTCPEARKASLNTPADSRQRALRRAGVRGGLERLSQEHSGRHAVSDRRDNVGLHRVPEQTGRHSVALPLHTRRSAAREPSLDRAIFLVVTAGKTRAAAETSPSRDTWSPAELHVYARVGPEPRTRCSARTSLVGSGSDRVVPRSPSNARSRCGCTATKVGPDLSDVPIIGTKAAVWRGSVPGNRTRDGATLGRGLPVPPREPCRRRRPA